jgi:protein TonB
MHARSLGLALLLLAGAAHADPPAPRAKSTIEHPKRPTKPLVPRLSTRAPPVKAPPVVKAPTPAPAAKKPPVVMKPPAPKPEPPEPRPEPRRRRSPTGEDEARDPLLRKR